VNVLVIKYILPLKLQLRWVELIDAYSRREWVAGLRLVDGVIDWFGFKVGSKGEVEPIDLEGVTNPVGTVHYHPYEHSVTPIPSVNDCINWVYSSYHEIPNDLNPIFFIVFKDRYASWVMFPKPPVIRKLWVKEYFKVRTNVKDEAEARERATVNLCLELPTGDLIKAGIFKLGEQDKVFITF